MRILLVHNTLNDSVSISGVLREYVNMANVWVQEGHQVDFLSGRVAHKQLGVLAPECGLLSSDDYFNATAHMDQPWRHFPAYAWRCISALRMPTEGYDIIYATCPFVVETYCARNIARRLEVPWVVKIQHVLSAQTQRTGLINRLLLWGETRSAKWASQDAAKIFCLSPTVYRDYKVLEEQLGLKISDTETIGSSIDLDQFSVLSETGKKYDVVFLGRIHSLKGIFDLPDVWSRLKGSCPEATLTVIGEGPHRGAVMDRFREQGLMDGVRFTGAIPEVEKNRLLSEARIGLSLSSEEGWGLAVNEYLACGLPVVAYDLPVFREVFPDMLNSVPLGDLTAASQAILELLDDPKERQLQGQIGREYVQRYDYRTMAREELKHLLALSGLC
ncbi:MAG: glycosyltransferase family 4 protein [Verrucomicrobiota bacterium]|nr:glycosyltransferase family 4 protein [Verrucomicrobiota bacterium]